MHLVESLAAAAAARSQFAVAFVADAASAAADVVLAVDGHELVLKVVDPCVSADRQPVVARTAVAFAAAVAPLPAEPSAAVARHPLGVSADTAAAAVDDAAAAGWEWEAMLAVHQLLLLLLRPVACSPDQVQNGGHGTVEQKCWMPEKPHRHPASQSDAGRDSDCVRGRCGLKRPMDS